MKKSDVFLPDTNTLLRYLLNDEPGLFARARDFWEEVREGRRKAVLTEGVLMECVYVLQRFYKIPREKITSKLSIIFGYKGLDRENIDLYVRAFSIYRETRLDFVDCLLASREISHQGIVFSFDDKLNALIRRGAKP